MDVFIKALVKERTFPQLNKWKEFGQHQNEKIMEDSVVIKR